MMRTKEKTLQKRKNKERLRKKAWTSEILKKDDENGKKEKQKEWEKEKNLKIRKFD